MPEPSKPARRKTRDDRIDWEELERAPNMKGMLSYLAPMPEEALALEPPPSASLPGESEQGDSPVSSLGLSSSGGAAVALAPETSHSPESETIPAATLPGETPRSETLPGVSVTLLGSTAPTEAVTRGPQPRETLPGASRQEPGADASSLNHLLADPFFRETPTTLVPGFGKRRFHRCVRVEDAHTAGEQLLLETLYRLARDPRWGRAEPDGAWLVTISMDELARHVRLHRTNVRANLTKLRAKLAIDLVALEDVREQSSRTYRLYPPAQILARRQQAGLEWVVKNRSVSFVPAEMVAEAIRREMPPPA